MSEPAPQGRPARTKLLRRILRATARMRPVVTVLQAVYYALRVVDELTG
ncbi:hypothetical protein [Streptomyces glaucescens]|uniref:Uncharacterized protein n=1 Tax=Streptomyces glaucescens TaxID=1907 RepID=A0A089YQW4_STRGA|nr:hypothetical protein [Streptomyces glaucescens]AIR96050.1 hypothetical protein SGLAU_00090 [Streptomyces glaucescens]